MARINFWKKFGLANWVNSQWGHAKPGLVAALAVRVNEVPDGVPVGMAVLDVLEHAAGSNPLFKIGAKALESQLLSLIPTITAVTNLADYKAAVIAVLTEKINSSRIA